MDGLVKTLNQKYLLYCKALTEKTLWRLNYIKNAKSDFAYGKAENETGRELEDYEKTKRSMLIWVFSQPMHPKVG